VEHGPDSQCFPSVIGSIADDPSSHNGARRAQAPDTVQAFVASFATPTPRTGKIARWEDGVCPRTVGQRPALAGIVDPAGEGPCGFCRRAGE